ncbi:MAG TPA: hypothetical protein VIT92_02725 [Burkholderiaceae bacterium]
MRKKFVPVEFENPVRPRALRPLFTGRFADNLDSFVDGCSTLFGLVAFVAGMVLPIYFLLKYGHLFVITAAWLKLASLIFVAVACMFLLWISSWTTRLIALGISGLIFFGAWQYL